MEHVDLARTPHAERQRWRNGPEWDMRAHGVAVGELAGGWYVRMYGGGLAREQARAYSGPHAEHYARGTARRWMRTLSGEWAEA